MTVNYLRTKPPGRYLIVIYFFVLLLFISSLIAAFVFRTELQLETYLAAAGLFWLLFFWLGKSFYGKIYSPLRALYIGIQHLVQKKFSYNLPLRVINHSPDLAQIYRILCQELNAQEQKIRDLSSQIEQSKKLDNQLEKQLQDLSGRNAYLEEKDRAKTDFLSVVSHELRTPLASIKGFASTLVLRDKSINELKRREYLKIIDIESDRLARLIEDLLNLSRIELGRIKLQWQELNVLKIVKRVLDQLSIKSSAIQFNLDFQSEFPNLVVDEDQLERVFVNLIGNAIKYSPPHGTITIIGRVIDQYRVAITIADQGSGIPASQLKTIFEKFYRVDDEINRTKPGTGLGLSICKAIVEAHGGEIWAESEINKGTRISFHLPIKRAAEPEESVIIIEENLHKNE
ncbi:MAG: ATP-binding protein [Elusimicrobiota bacterium]